MYIVHYLYPNIYYVKNRKFHVPPFILVCLITIGKLCVYAYIYAYIYVYYNIIYQNTYKCTCTLHDVQTESHSLNPARARHSWLYNTIHTFLRKKNVLQYHKLTVMCLLQKAVKIVRHTCTYYISYMYRVGPNKCANSNKCTLIKNAILGVF